MGTIIWKKSTVLWLLTLAIMAGFQWWRGARVDGVLFTAVVIILVIDLLNGSPAEPQLRRLILPRGVVVACATIVGITLTFTPRNSWFDLIAVIIAGAGVMLLTWTPPTNRELRPDHAVRRSATLWAIMALTLCVWEALALVFSATSALEATIALQAFPTVSVLLDPFLESWIGHVFFVACWLLAGLGLLRLQRQP